MATLQFLGTGASLGVPVVACDCAVCTSSDPKNKRLRPAALLTVGDKKILIDCGPDIREQCLRIGLKAIDGLILTHAHYDHADGLDELRAFSIQSGKKLDILLSQATLDEIKQRFYYIFQLQNSDQVITTRMSIQMFPGDQGKVSFLGHSFGFCTFEQMGMAVNGFRLGNMAYLSDIKRYEDKIFDELKGVEILVISALRFTPSKMHFTIDEAIAFADRVGVAQVFLTHISHDVDHKKTDSLLPKHVRLAYDGLSITFDEKEYGAP